GAGDVRVKIDDGKSRARDVRLRHMQHALGLVALKRQHVVWSLRLRRRGLARAIAGGDTSGAKGNPFSAIHFMLLRYEYRSAWWESLLRAARPVSVAASRGRVRHRGCWLTFNGEALAVS